MVMVGAARASTLAQPGELRSEQDPSVSRRWRASCNRSAVARALSRGMHAVAVVPLGHSAAARIVVSILLLHARSRANAGARQTRPRTTGPRPERASPPSCYARSLPARMRACGVVSGNALSLNLATKCGPDSREARQNARVAQLSRGRGDYLASPAAPLNDADAVPFL
jgi:hypothetical protein